MQFRLLRALAPGEELTIQYTDLYLPRGLRRAKLASSHGFECMCERCCDCQALAVDRRVEGFRCREPGCAGLVPPPPGVGSGEENTSPPWEWLCVQCGVDYSAKSQSLLAIAARAADEYSSAVAEQKAPGGSHEACRTRLEQLLRDVEPVLYPEHTVLYNTHHHLFSSCNALEDTEDATDHCHAALRCLKNVYPPFHPEVGQRGKLIQPRHPSPTNDGGGGSWRRSTTHWRIRSGTAIKQVTVRNPRAAYSRLHCREAY